jgi:hypothetical protein
MNQTSETRQICWMTTTGKRQAVPGGFYWKQSMSRMHSSKFCLGRKIVRIQSDTEANVNYDMF